MPECAAKDVYKRQALNLIRKYLPEGAFSRIYLDEQPVDAGNYVAGALALESSDMNTAGFAMFKINAAEDVYKRQGCVFGGVVNEAIEKAKTADGFVFGSPVHYASASGNRCV